MLLEHLQYQTDCLAVDLLLTSCLQLMTVLQLYEFLPGLIINTLTEIAVNHALENAALLVV
jgi:hypothetical protein